MTFNICMYFLLVFMATEQNQDQGEYIILYPNKFQSYRRERETGENVYHTRSNKVKMSQLGQMKKRTEVKVTSTVFANLLSSGKSKVNF